MTRVAARILDRMRALISDPASGWTPVATGHGSPMIRFTETVPTPDYCRGTGFGRWDQPTYETHVFVTLTTSKVLLRTCAAPWVGASDTEVPFWLAELILEDPALALDNSRRNALRAARRGPVK